jgi:antitoxin component of RelBE/YafQ-DinJ toxin-antitoxin module
MGSVMIRVDESTRNDLTRVASEDLGGVSADEAIRRLLAQHWQMKAIAALDAYRANDPEGWADYVADADRDDRTSAPAADPWDEAA